MRKSFVVAAIAAASVLGTTAVAAQENTGKRFNVTLEGENEVPNTGDPDGTGQATVRINSGQEQLCYSLTVSGIAPATAAHIHEAPKGAAGPVVFPLNAPTSGKSEGCVSITREQAKELAKNPDDYYVNVHNAEFPGGALRGQLGQ